MSRLSDLDKGRPVSRKEAAMRAVQSDPARTVRLNANIPRTLHKQAKAYALEHDLTLTDLVIQAISTQMSQEGEK